MVFRQTVGQSTSVAVRIYLPSGEGQQSRYLTGVTAFIHATS
jgi:hypothetical protein